MSNIYDQHDAAFKAVSAYVILKDGIVVAKVAFKFGASVTAFVHWIGVEMVRGRAGGGGYDRQSAAVSDAAAKHLRNLSVDTSSVSDVDTFIAFWRAAVKDGGATWIRSLELAGFDVVQAV